MAVIGSIGFGTTGNSQAAVSVAQQRIGSAMFAAQLTGDANLTNSIGTADSQSSITSQLLASLSAGTGQFLDTHA